MQQPETDTAQQTSDQPAAQPAAEKHHTFEVLIKNDKNNLRSTVQDIINTELADEMRELCKEIRLLRLAVDELCASAHNDQPDSVDSSSTTGSIYPTL